MPLNDASACGEGCAILGGETDPREARRTRRAWWGIGIGVVLAGNSMMLGLAVNTSETTPPVRLGLHGALLAATLLAFFFLGPPLLAAAWQQLRRGRLTIEALFLSGLLGAWAASLLSIITGEGPVYFETVIVLLVVYAFGQQVTRISQRRALRSIESWRGMPQTCEVLQPDGSEKSLPVERVTPGDEVVVHPGRMIPVDGTITHGEAFIQQSQWTGEFFSVSRSPGDPVFAGSHCLDGTLIVRATTTGNQRRIDHLARAVEQARLHPSKLQSEADRIVRWFLPVVLILAILTFAGWSWFMGWRSGLFNAMAVLLVACPCAMGFATPICVWSGIGLLAQSGLIARRGDLIENLASVDTVVLDKTGTLTELRPSLVDLGFSTFIPLDRATVRRLIGAVQRASDHPIAAAFVDLESPLTEGERDAELSDLPSVRVLGVRPLPGKGLSAQCLISGHDRPVHVIIGSEDLAVSSAHHEAWDRLCRYLGGSVQARRIAIFVDDCLVAAAVVDERILETSLSTLDSLRAMGLRLVIMTGDRSERCGALEGIEIHAGLAPEDKLCLIRSLRDQGRRVLFIGDGLNDAMAMAESPASVAVGSGASLALESAGAVLLEPDLTPIPWAIRLCHRARRTIHTNLRLAAAYNAIGMALAGAGLLHPVAAAVLMTCSSLVVSLRSLRLLDDQEEKILNVAPRDPLRGSPDPAPVAAESAGSAG